MVTETYLVKRIEMMREELELLKKTILGKDVNKNITLRGVWKGVDFSDKEIDEATHSWSKGMIE